ncbi:MAG: hypothetical protein A3K19_11075 [Lentisphaerae bacterium RIFOXYB12_FULL_65_16]|nr:MAG: hypothetical protein A3K18_31445 [Lentisphaerae bacterium RIFOXYA12_64_32]OGV91723.1 MAG: hypothetical protein A3K19_11075 [Lentisphaerae bacterium RIFOXYB12_FULL_65_16]
MLVLLLWGVAGLGVALAAETGAQPAAATPAPAGVTAAPAQPAPVQPASTSDDEVVRQYRERIRIRPGDTIAVRLKEDDEVKYDGEVSAAGLIPLPYLGNFTIAGKTAKEVEQALRVALERDLYTHATPSVLIVKRAPRSVSVFGAVPRPGRVAFPAAGDLTMIDAVTAVDGLTSWADAHGAYILRTGPDGSRTKVPADIAKAYEALDGPANLPLSDNDVLFVPSAGTGSRVLSAAPVEIIISGEVTNPGVVSFPPGEKPTFVRAIFRAGNFTQYAKTSSVRLVRYNQDGTRTTKTVDAKRIIQDGYMDEDFELFAGDMIIVDEKNIVFK